jgi:hypothetical protein
MGDHTYTGHAIEMRLNGVPKSTSCIGKVKRKSAIERDEARQCVRGGIIVLAPLHLLNPRVKHMDIEDFSDMGHGPSYFTHNLASEFREKQSSNGGRISECIINRSSNNIT